MSDANPARTSLKQEEMNKLRDYLMQAVHRELENNPAALQSNGGMISELLEKAYERTRLQLSPTLREQVFHDVTDNLMGYGPIQPLLDEPEVTEVMVNAYNSVYVERNGRLEKTGVQFDDDAHVLRVIERIVLPLGRRIDADSPAVDARLPDGSRVNAIVPPVAIDGPSLTIRKFSKERLGIQDLINFGSITEPMAEFLEACVKAHLNIVISGGTGSGKTTLLNILSGFIPEEERIVTIEDAAELQLQQDHVVRLETKAANLDGMGEMTIRQLVRNSLRMRPDRIVVGEVRGGEALDMLQAMNTGHDGSLTTVHANTPRDASSRLETLTLMAGMELPLRIVREQIASAVDVIVQQSRLPDGARKVTYITEVGGMEGDTVVMTDVFKFEQTGTDAEGNALGELRPTGIRPMFMHRLEAAGFKLGAQIFLPATDNQPLVERRRRR
ncbi:MAG: CpaF family protein [Chloroflexi bacterium]|nr:MAG: CpaF family protein [Chloroflexota bacterium]MBL1196867.1 CpaF family protein [Chloroflexota bacterium]NOH14163.1 CpaF family protein [Chloroflexota bacterium]